MTTVELYNANIDPPFRVFSARGDASQSKLRHYKKRKKHTKVNTGCTTCRMKRVKCDEQRPICARCQRNNWCCVYDNGGDSVVRKVTSLSCLSATTVIPSSLATARGTSTIHLVTHLHRDWADIFSTSYDASIASMFADSALARNAMLAVAASHMRHLSPACIQHRIAEYELQAIALSEYQKSMRTPPESLGQSGANALLFSALLISMLSFTLGDHESHNGVLDPMSSWVFMQRQNRLGWFALQSGVRPLMLSLLPYIEGVLQLLGPIFLGHPSARWPPPARKPLEGVPDHWIEAFGLIGLDGVCDIKQSDPSRPVTSSEIFRPLVEVLAHLQQPEALHFNIFASLTFLSKMHPEFRALLAMNDPRALWIFGYWLGQMYRFERTWWCWRRIKRDREAIRIWLDQQNLTQRSETEGKMWKRLMLDYDSAPRWFEMLSDRQHAVTISCPSER